MYVTVPFNEVVEHQKQVAHLPKKDRSPVPIDHTKGDFLFSLSPNDLVYVPTDEEIDNPELVEHKTLSPDQVTRIYKMVSSSGSQCFFIHSRIAKPVVNKVEFSALNKMERDLNENMIKERCWKFKIDRLGNIVEVIK